MIPAVPPIPNPTAASPERIRSESSKTAANEAALEASETGSIGHAPTLVSLSGDIDHYTAHQACRVLDAIDGPAIVDLAGVRLLSAAALAELVRAAKRVGSKAVTLSAPSAGVRALLERMRFDELFIIEA